MDDSGSTSTRGHRLAPALAVGWLVLGCWSLADGRTWLGVTTLAFAVLHAWSYVRPDSALARFLDQPLFRRRRTTGG